MSNRAKNFTEAFDDLPDGAFFALAEEHGIDMMEFANQNEIETEDELDTLKALKRLKINAVRKNSSSFQLATNMGNKVMFYTPKRAQDFIYDPKTGKKHYVQSKSKIKDILTQIDGEQSC